MCRPEQSLRHYTKDMVMVKQRWMPVSEAEVRMVEGPYEDTKRRLLLGTGMSIAFKTDLQLLLLIINIYKAQYPYA